LVPESENGRCERGEAERLSEAIEMVRVIATFIAVWFAIGAIGVLVQATIVPIPNTAVSLIGLAVAATAAFVTYRRLHRDPRV